MRTSVVQTDSSSVSLTRSMPAVLEPNPLSGRGALCDCAGVDGESCDIVAEAAEKMAGAAATNASMAEFDDVYAGGGCVG